MRLVIRYIWMTFLILALMGVYIYMEYFFINPWWANILALVPLIIWGSWTYDMLTKEKSDD